MTNFSSTTKRQLTKLKIIGDAAQPDQDKLERVTIDRLATKETVLNFISANSHLEVAAKLAYTGIYLEWVSMLWDNYDKYCRAPTIVLGKVTQTK